MNVFVVFIVFSCLLEMLSAQFINYIWYDMWATSTYSWYCITSDITGQYIAAAANGQGIYTSRSYGTNFTLTIGTSFGQWNAIASTSNGSIVLAAAYEGALYVSRNYGLSFVSDGITAGKNWYAVSVSGNGQLMAAAENSGSIWLSYNQGYLWTEQAGAPSNFAWQDLAISRENSYIFAVATSKVIYVSADSGITWSASDSLVENLYTSVSISDDGQYGIAVAANSGILYTTNYGQNWTKSTSAPADYWMSVAGSSSGQYAIAAASDGCVYETYEYGVTWTLTESNVRSFEGVTMNGDASQVFAVVDGSNGGIWKGNVSSLPAVTTATPTEAPSTIPSISTIPTLQPSQQPTLSPVSDDATRSPSIAPTIIPSPISNAPTAIPTTKENTELYVTQIIKGLTISQYDSQSAADSSTLIDTIVACSPGITSSNVMDFSASAPNTTVNEITLSYSIVCNVAATVEKELTAAVLNDQFTTTMHEIAVTYAATYLETATCDSIDISTSSTDDDDNNNGDEDHSMAIIIIVLMGLFALAVGLLALLFRSQSHDLLNEINSNLAEVIDIMLKSFNISVTFYNLLTQTDGVVFFSLLILSKVIIFIAWVVFMFVFLVPIRRHNDLDQPLIPASSDLPPLSMLFHKPSLSLMHVFYVFHGLRLAMAHITVYVMVFTVGMLDITFLRLLPWLKTSFTAASNGYPNLFAMRCCLYGSFSASLIQTIAILIVILSDNLTASSLILLITSIIGLIKVFISMVLYLQAAVANEFKLVIVNYDDVTAIIAYNNQIKENENRASRISRLSLDERDSKINSFSVHHIGGMIEHRVSLGRLSSAEAKVTDIPPLTANVDVENPDDRSSSPGEVARINAEFASIQPYADLTLNVLQTQLKNMGVKPLAFIPLTEIKAELATIFEKVNSGQPHDEGRLDYLLMCMDINEEYIAEKAAVALKWRNEMKTYLADCLQQMKRYIPAHITVSSMNHLVTEDKMTNELARRIFSKQCLWLIRKTKHEIDKTHEAELYGRYNPGAQGLDIIEQGAILAAVPEKFATDPTGKKQRWRDAIEDQMKVMHAQMTAGTLPKNKKRHPAYQKQVPLYESEDIVDSSNSISEVIINSNS